MLLTTANIGLHMGKSKTIGVRFNGKLLTNIERHDLNNCELIRTVMQRYFNNDGSNETLDAFANNDNTNVSKSANAANNEYDSNLVDLLTQQHELLTNQLASLQDRNKKLEGQVEFYHVQDLPFWKRRRYNKQMNLLTAAGPAAAAANDVTDL